jgi:sugar-specific transcriptional regulator TrmB
MSEDRVSKTLQEMGFSDIETRIYLFLSKRGQQKGRDLALALKINKQQLYPSLKNLQNKGIVSQTLEHPARFNALPFDRIIDLYLKAKMEEVRRIEQSKDQILSDWQSIVVNAAEGQSDRFMVFEGRTRIFSTLEKMIQESKKNLQAIASVNGVRQVDAAGLFEKAQIHMSKSHIKFSLLLDLTSNDEKLIQKLLKGISKGQKNLQVRSPILPLKAFPTLLMKDNEEILLFIKPLGENSRNEKADVCLWTNCRTIITAFDTIFQDLWHTSTQTKSGLSLEDQQSKVTYQSTEDLAEKIEKAKNEIFILTSSEGLVNLQISPNTLAVLKEKGIQIKILATIDQKNFETAKLLSQYSTIKHIPENTLDVIVVDKTHLFQSRHNLSKDKVGSHLVYSQSIQYIERMKETLDEMWKSAQKPSEVTLESISGPYGYSVFPTPNQAQKAKIESTTNYQFKVLNIKPAALTTEKDILNKILHGKKHAITKANKVNVMYASAASAVIHPPSNFNLPKMLINVNHIRKKIVTG